MFYLLLNAASGPAVRVQRGRLPLHVRPDPLEGLLVAADGHRLVRVPTAPVAPGGGVRVRRHAREAVRALPEHLS